MSGGVRPYVHPGPATAGAAPGPALLGGKGANLARLAALDLGVEAVSVPPWYALTTAAFRDTLRETGLAERIADLTAGLEGDPGGVSRRIRSWILELELPAELARQLAESHHRLLPGDASVAVRSSAVDEDGSGCSFAGLYESVLGVRGTRAVLSAVKRVWASAYSPQALAYRRAKQLPLDAAAMAVIVQQMVPAAASGVLFTADPATGDAERILIHAVYGLGEGVMEGDLPADRFRVGKTGFEMESTVAEKTERLIETGQARGGLRRAPVPEEMRRTSTLSEARVRALARAGLALENAAGRPQDVEFAITEEGAIALLQARPVTVLEEDGPAAGNPIEWDNAAWVENLSGVVSPMTFSVTRRTGNLASRFLIDLLGIDRRWVDAHPALFELPLGYIRGRLYLRRGVLVRVLGFVPGARFSPRRLAALLGARGKAPWMDEPISRQRRFLVELPALLRLAARAARRLLGSPRASARFESYAQDLYERAAAIDFDRLTASRLIDFYEEIERELVLHWQAPQLNGLYAKAFYGLLGKLCRRWCGDRSGALSSELLRGEEGLRSLEPVHDQMRLARAIRREPALAELFASHPPEELAALVAGDPRWASFAAGVERHLDLYFFKCPDEMKLEAPSLRDRPAELYQALKRYAAEYREEDLDVEARTQRERQARRAAEDQAFAALGRHPLRRWLLARAMRHARRGVRNRENLKFIRLQMIGLFRELIRAVGQRFAEHGILGAADDVFYLTLEEVVAYLRGQAVTADLHGLVAVRREEIEGYRRDPPERVPGDRFTTYGAVYHRNRYRRRQEPPPAGEAPRGTVLRGIPACRGTAIGVTRVLEDPAAPVRLSGEVLVVPTVRTAWAVHFPAIAGLLIERGSVLSHTATLAREMGIPTVVEVPGLVAALRSGQRVRVDGGAGTVEVLDEDPA